MIRLAERHRVGSAACDLAVCRVAASTVWVSHSLVGIISTTLLLVAVCCFRFLLNCCLRWILGVAGLVLDPPCNTHKLRVSHVEVWLYFVRFALLLAVVLSWVARCFGSWVLLGLFCLLRVPHRLNTPVPRSFQKCLPCCGQHCARRR